MIQIWSIARQQLLILARDRSAIIWMLLVPCMYIFVFGNAFRNNSDRSGNKATLGVYNQDTGYLSQEFIKSLESENLYIQNLESETGDLPPRYIVIPSDFTANILAKIKTTIRLTNKPDANIEAGATANIAVRKASVKLLANISELSTKNQPLSTETLQAIKDREPLVILKTSNAGQHITIPSGYNQQVPANIVMITMIMVFTFGAVTLIEERQSGMLKRIRTGPVSLFQLFLGKLTGVTIIGMVQIILLLFLGRVIFGVYFGNDIIALFLLILGFSITTGSMGLVLGFLIQEEEKVIALSIVLALAMSAISGCWWPLEIAPAWMQKTAMLLPSGITLKALHEMISFGNGIETVWPNILGITAYGTIFTIIAAGFMTRFYSQSS